VKQALRIAWRWIWSWAAVGLTIGVLLMFVRVEFMAESGSHPDDLGSYAFWIPVLGVLAIVFGIASGLPFGFAVVNAKLYPARSAMPDLPRSRRLISWTRRSPSRRQREGRSTIESGLGYDPLFIRRTSCGRASSLF